MKVYEVNFDGLVGPTHHYAGLAYGNEASMNHALQRSNPKVAALQGLDKMELLHRLGVKQGCLLPQTRPYMALLNHFGFAGDEQRVLELVYQSYPQLFRAAFSAASMWTANCATMTPASDTHDGHMHITIANLASQLHRAIEPVETMPEFKQAFGQIAQVHDPLPFAAQLYDEGAANHMRLAPSHAAAGVHVFVYGKSLFKNTRTPLRYPARQVLEASQAIARHHLIKTPVVFLQQHPDSIDEGVFHNDVIAISNETVLIVHERAFLEPGAIDEIISSCDFELNVITVTEAELSLADVIRTYFFNSQLVTVNSGEMHMILPTECEQHEGVQRLVQRILDEDNPVSQVHYVNCRQSMQNGGGPACLRFRMQIDEANLYRMDQRFLLTDDMFVKLRACIETYYPDELAPKDFLDADLRARCAKAVLAIKALFC